MNKKLIEFLKKTYEKWPSLQPLLDNGKNQYLKLTKKHYPSIQRKVRPLSKLGKKSRFSGWGMTTEHMGHILNLK